MNLAGWQWPMVTVWVPKCIIKARELGASPTDIGEALGITRQAVYNRLHNLEQRAEHDPVFVSPDLSGEDVEETAKETADLEHTTDQRERPIDSAA